MRALSCGQRKALRGDNRVPAEGVKTPCATRSGLPAWPSSLRPSSVSDIATLPAPPRPSARRPMATTVVPPARYTETVTVPAPRSSSFCSYPPAELRAALVVAGGPSWRRPGCASSFDRRYRRRSSGRQRRQLCRRRRTGRARPSSAGFRIVNDDAEEPLARPRRSMTATRPASRRDRHPGAIGADASLSAEGRTTREIAGSKPAAPTTEQPTGVLRAL